MSPWRVCLILSDADAVVVGLGATTSVGRSALASAAAVRAGVSGFTQHAFMVDSLGLPMRVAAFPWLDENHDIVDRIVVGLITAIREALAPLFSIASQLPIALFVNLPSPRPALPSDLSELIYQRLRCD